MCMSFVALLMQMAALFLPVVVGFVAAKLGFMDDAFDSALSRLVLNVTLPCMLVASASTSDALPDAWTSLELLGISMAGYVVATVLGYAVAWLMRAPAADRGVYAFMIAFGNVGFIGYPVLSAILGEKAVVFAAIANIANLVFIFSVGAVMIQGGKTAATATAAVADGGQPGGAAGLIATLKANARSIFSPTFFASLTLLVLVVLRVNHLGVVGEGLKVAGSLTTPAVLLVTGASLASYRPLSMLTNWRAYVAAAVRLLVVPVLMLVLFRPFLADAFVRSIIVIGTGMPVATVAVLFCLTSGRDAQVALQGTFITVIASVLTIPLVALLV